MSDISYPDLLFQTLQDEKMTFTAAESCTGGLISKLMTDFPGSSNVFWGGFITYSNEAKRKLLSVDGSILEKYGAVSRNTVIAMAEGAIKNSGADCSVSVSGVAGPGGGSESKPVGTVWICALLATGELKTERLIFSGDRSEVRSKAASYALKMVYHLILDNQLLTVNK